MTAVNALGFSARVDLSGGWEYLTRALNPDRFERDLARHAARATLLNARDYERTVRRYVAREVYAANTPFTVQLKGGSVPLLDYGDMLASIATRPVGRDAYFVGVGRDARWTFRADNGGSYATPHRDGRTLVDVAEMLHEGFVIRFTPEVIRAIMAKLAARQGTTLARSAGLTAPGSLLGSIRVVPGRPFIRRPFEEQALQLRCADRWEAALERALLTDGAPAMTAPAVFEEVA